jgi:hypothetical protein
MLNFFSARRCAAVFLTLCLVACGGAVLIVPLFSFGFSNGDVPVANQVGIFFNSPDPKTESGVFNPDSVNLKIGNDQTTYNGSYSGCSFQLKASGPVTPPAAEAYAGGFRTKDTIQLRRPSDNALIYELTRKPQSPAVVTPDFGC